MELLEQEHQERLAIILWHKLDNFGLPDGTTYYKFAFLNLPHPTNVKPISLLKKFIFSEQIPIQRNSMGQGIGITFGEIPICSEILGANRYIHWTDAEINDIFNRLVAWWDADKEFLMKDSPALPFGSIVDEFKARFRHLINICADVIAPKFNQNTEIHQKETLLRLITELQKYELPMLRLEFACLHLFPERKTDFFEKIESALASDILEVMTDSLQSIWMLIDRNELLLIESDWAIILNIVGQIVRWRKKSGLPNALRVFKHLIIKHPSLFNQDIEKSVLIGLQQILHETAMEEIGSLNLFERLEIRKEAAGLAYELFNYYLTQAKTVPTVIVEWQNVCDSENEFAEIRNQWIREAG